MYYNKLEPILKDLEDKNVEIAGGSAVGIVLSVVNSLIKYIANLTLNKKNYEEVQEDIISILDKAQELKSKSLEAIDKDKETLEEFLSAYKIRKQNETLYQEVCKRATEFGIEVVKIAIDTLKLTLEISKVGNKMLTSDFKICKYYSFASVQASLENVYINVESILNEEYKKKVKIWCQEAILEAEEMLKET